MYDNTCKFIAETFTTDIVTWLLGQPIALTRLEPSELSVESIRADSLVLLQSQSILFHGEFQTRPKPDIPFRMADYRLRGHRRYPSKPMHQVVVYLCPSRSPLIQQTCFELERTRHEFDVICLWKQPTATFLRAPGLFHLQPSAARIIPMAYCGRLPAGLRR